MKKCKITVLKREFYQELADEYIAFPDFGPCHMMKEGDVFITGGPFGNQMPQGFCDMAWQAIGMQASVLAGGGKVKFVADLMDGFGYYEKKGVYYAFHTGTGGQEYYYHKLKGAKTTYILYRRGNSYFAKVTKSCSPMYLSESMRISKSAYKKELKKYVGSKKLKSFKNYYSNTAENRKVYLK